MYLSLDYTGLSGLNWWVYPNVSPSSNRAAFLTTPAEATSELGAAGNNGSPEINGTATLLLSSVKTLQAGDNEFLLRVIGSGVARVKLSLNFAPSSVPVGMTLLDSAVLTIQSPEQYYTLASARGDGSPTVPFEDPIQTGGNVNMDVFPWSFVTNHIDPNIDNSLIFVHGFNVTFANAQSEFAEAYKRAFWQGFRGNFIGFTWYGDPPLLSTPLTTGDGSPFWSKFNFNGAVQNALETAGTFLDFLENLEAPTFAHGLGMSPNKVNVMAHSLGNLVVWDALRIADTRAQGAVLNNLIDVESAVWADAYRPLAPVTYNLPNQQIVLSETDLEIDSWLGYFVPSDVPTEAVAGNVVNSYYSEDQALQYWERLNDGVFNSEDKASTPGAPFRDDTNLWNTPRYGQGIGRRLMVPPAQALLLARCQIRRRRRTSMLPNTAGATPIAAIPYTTPTS